MRPPLVSIFVIGFPKSGTTTLQTAFGRAGLTSAHWRVPGGFCGELIYEDFYAGRDPLERFPELYCMGEPDVCRPDQRKNGAELNYWPQLDFDVIKAIERFNPGMRFLLNKRRVPDLIRSIDKWGGDFRQRVTGCDIPGLPPGKGATDDELREWIEGHYGACQEYFGGRETFLEFDIAEPETRGRLADFLGVELPWWGVANAKGQPKLGGPAAATNGGGAAEGADPEADPADPDGGGHAPRARILAAAREL